MEYTKSSFENEYTAQLSFFETIRQAFLGVFFYGDDLLNPVLWTMKYELFGSFLVFFIITIVSFSKSKIFHYTIYTLALVLSALVLGVYYSAFILGVWLCDLQFNHSISMLDKLKFKYLSTILVIVGIYLSSYPYVNTSGTMYGMLPMISNYRNQFIVLYHIAGAFFLIWVVLISPRLQSFFSNKISQFLGKISFSMYLVHFLVITSFSSYVFKISIENFGLSYNPGFAISFVASLFILIPISYLIYKYVDLKTLAFNKLVYEKIFRKPFLMITQKEKKAASKQKFV